MRVSENLERPADTLERPTTPGGEIAAAISAMAVRLMHERTGRGAARSRTYLQGDLAVVVLSDTFTAVERTLLERGEVELVLGLRRALVAAMREDLITGVAAFTAREVVAFMADHHIQPDVTVVIFVLGPSPSDTRQLPHAVSLEKRVAVPE